ncbi:hypothetical protein DPMN_132655 [Dreissena polymorpha]|uniref:CCHC-type domain-containing protein n=1 Tax=Dreissena polymorpha TaxID=45954 RepID=A0A9D4FWJ2_DREPO|nr:hypothetical protein DPMN_132655 [Dreissena polymorpha]
MVHVVGILKEKGWTSDDIDAIASGPPGSGYYDVVFDDKAKCEVFSTSVNGQIKFRDVLYDITLHGKQIIQLRVHWLPICTKRVVIKEILSNFGRVLSVDNEMYEIKGFACKSGTRLVTIEVSDAEKASIPHLLKFQCGAKALVTIRGRPPLCSRCFQLGHVRGECPDRGSAHQSGTWADKVKRRDASATEEDIPSSLDTSGTSGSEGKVAPDGSVEPISEAQWLQQKKRHSKPSKPDRAGGSTESVNPQTRGGKGDTKRTKKTRTVFEGAPIEAETPSGEMQGEALVNVVSVTDDGVHHEMDTNIQGTKRSIDDGDSFTPMPKNKPGSGPVPSPEDPFDGMFTHDSVKDGLLATQSPHHNAIN